MDSSSPSVREILDLIREFMSLRPRFPTAYLTTHDALRRLRDGILSDVVCAGHPDDAMPIEIHGTPIYSYATRAEVLAAIASGVGGANPVVIASGDPDDSVGKVSE